MCLSPCTIMNTWAYIGEVPTKACLVQSGRSSGTAPAFHSFHQNLPMLHLTMRRLSSDSPVRPASLLQWLHNFPSFEGSSNAWIIRLDGVPMECDVWKLVFDRPHFPFPKLLNP